MKISVQEAETIHSLDTQGGRDTALKSYKGENVTLHNEDFSCNIHAI